MVEVSYRDPRPLYEQVRDAYRAQILAGALPPGTQMPSVRELSARLAINPNTIQRAYRELEQEGWIGSVRGKGSFVADPTDAGKARREELLRELDRVARELRALGCTTDELAKRIQEGDGGNDDR